MHLARSESEPMETTMHRKSAILRAVVEMAARQAHIPPALLESESAAGYSRWLRLRSAATRHRPIRSPIGAARQAVELWRVSALATFA